MAGGNVQATWPVKNQRPRQRSMRKAVKQPPLESKSVRGPKDGMLLSSLPSISLPHCLFSLLTSFRDCDVL